MTVFICFPLTLVHLIVPVAILILPLFVFLRVCQDPKEEENAYAFFDSCRN